MGIMGIADRETGVLSVAQVEAAINESSAFATDLAGRVSAESQAMMKKSVEAVVANGSVALKRFEEAAALGASNFDMMVSLTKLWVGGTSDLAKAQLAAAQLAIEAQVAHAKALTGVKSLKEAIDLQTAFARTQAEQAMSHGAKTAEQVAKLSEKVAEPVLERVSATLSLAGKPLAA